MIRYRVDSGGRLLRVLFVCLAALITVAAAAREPGIDRWTRVTENVKPDVISNFSTMSVERAVQLLQTSDAALLYDSAAGFDQLPAGGLFMRSRRRVSGRDGFEIVPGEQGRLEVWQLGVRKKDRRRIDGPDDPPLRIIGLPTDVGRPAWQRLSDYNPVVVQFAAQTLVIQFVSVRVRDPWDRGSGGHLASLALGVTYRSNQVVQGDLSTWRPILTIGGRRGNDPRLIYLPVDGAGKLDTSRDGVMLRFSGVPDGVGWMTNLGPGLMPLAVRVHFGSEESLQERLDATPSRPRELYAEPGSPTDPLMLAPRTARDPIGAGVEIRQFVFADVNALQMPGGSVDRPSMVGRWDGVDLSGWFGRGLAGLTVRQDLVGARLMLRLGRMRDTHYTAVGLELGGHPLPKTAGQISSVALNGVLQSYRQIGREVFGRQVEIGNRLRLGTTGVEYESSGGVRIYTKNGLVIAPAGVVGGRWSFREGRAFLTLGVAVEASWNRNWFGKGAAPTADTSTERSPIDAALPAEVQ